MGGILGLHLNFRHFVRANTLDVSQPSGPLISLCEFLLNDLELPVLDLLQDRSILMDELSQMLSGLIETVISAFKDNGSRLCRREVPLSRSVLGLVWGLLLVEYLALALRVLSGLRIAHTNYLTWKVRVISSPALRHFRAGPSL